jgi:hypothetical protein
MRNLKGRHYMENLCIRGSVTLKCILKKKNVRTLIEFIGLGIAAIGGLL